MSRRRYLSTEVSLDARINRLAIEAGDFAALCYTWMIPHAEDDASITADAEELLFRVFPGRRDKTANDIAAAVDQMVELELLAREDRRLIFPPDAFYRYQSYIPGEKRRTAKNAENRRRTAKNTFSPSPSPSPSILCDGTPVEFENAMKSYPKRAGSNPRKPALKAWNARIREGITPADLHSGVERYAAYIRAVGKEGTEFVKQAATFFGPDEHWKEPWTISPNGRQPGGFVG